jgi:hypothetical protein
VSGEDVVRRQLTLGVVGWCAVVALVAFVVWQAIDAAGRDLFGAGAQTTGALASGTPAGPRSGPTRTSTPEPSPSRSSAGSSGSQTRSWQGEAGIVTARCSGNRIVLQSATPANGYAVTVTKREADEVRVELTRGDQEVRVEARCTAGVPTIEAEQRDDSSGSGGSGSGSGSDDG